MRIGIDVSPLSPARTGVGNYVYYLLKHLLREAGEDVFVPFSVGRGRVNLTGELGEAIAGGAAAHHRHIGTPARAMYRVWELFGRPRVDQYLGGVEVFHATNYFLPPVARARRVLTVYDLAFLRAPALCSPKIVGPFGRNVPRFAREADAVITCSEASKRDLVELAGVRPERVTVAYGAVDEGFLEIPRGAAAAAVRKRHGVRTPFVLFTGTIEPRKNIEGLLHGFALAQKEFPHDLVLAGGLGWGMENLEGRIAALGLTGRVRRLGYVPGHDALAALYSAAEALLFPSLYEGFGLPVVEAMTCGCPVIVSENSSLPEVAGAAGEYVRAESPESIAAGLRRVLGDPGRRTAMREAGYVQARRFSWRTCARITQEVYRSVAS